MIIGDTGVFENDCDTNFFTMNPTWRVRGLINRRIMWIPGVTIWLESGCEITC